MRVSVVVPTYRRPELLARCLAALARQRIEHAIEVVVADDADDEATRRLVGQLTTSRIRIKYVRVAGRHGPAAARNTGWRFAQGEIIGFTDDDCVPDSGWVAAAVAGFADAGVAAVTGQTIVPLPAEPTDHAITTAGLEGSEFITANCFCRREILVSLGGFDEQFTAAWREDSDLQFRILDAGGKIVRIAEAVVVHPVRQAAWGASLREQRKAVFDALLFHKHPQRYREQIEPICPTHYYLIVAAAVAAVLLLAAGWTWLALVAAAVWAWLTLSFALHRLQRTTRAPGHVLEMLLTSIAIPFLCVFWRLYGAARFQLAAD
jgi:GT2 family glycosyltransferase